jgi:hypothetical protein
VSEKSRKISRAIQEQKTGSDQIWRSIEKIKDIPKENKERSFRLNQRVRELVKDAELASTEMERFTFFEDASSGLLRMGVVPLESPAEMFRKFTPLAEYLGKKLKGGGSEAGDFRSDKDIRGSPIRFITPPPISSAYNTIKFWGAREGKPSSIRSLSHGAIVL